MFPFLSALQKFYANGFSACLHPKVSQELLDLTKQDEDIMSKMTAYDEEQKQKLENLNQVIKEKQKQDL